MFALTADNHRRRHPPRPPDPHFLKGVFFLCNDLVCFLSYPHYPKRNLGTGRPATSRAEPCSPSEYTHKEFPPSFEVVGGGGHRAPFPTLKIANWNSRMTMCCSIIGVLPRVHPFVAPASPKTPHPGRLESCTSPFFPKALKSSPQRYLVGAMGEAFRYCGRYKEPLSIINHQCANIQAHCLSNSLFVRCFAHPKMVGTGQSWVIFISIPDFSP